MKHARDQWRPNFLDDSSMFSPLTTVYDDRWRDNVYWPTLKEYNQLLSALNKEIRTHTGQDICFVKQAPTTREFHQQYEPRIYLTGEVQTRTHNWHDFFNMLVWLTFPKIKAAINARHYLAQKHRFNHSRRRTTIENILTHFDETGTIIVSSHPYLVQLLIEHQWHALFVKHRQQVERKMQFYLFGHALYEKALNPYIGMTGKSFIVHVEPQFFTWQLKQQLNYLDILLANRLMSNHCLLSSRQLAPLPVLGVPGWWQENEKIEFYNNVAYFRRDKDTSGTVQSIEVIKG